MTHYEVTLRLDTRSIPYHSALADVAKWWAGLPGMEPSRVPEHARLPMYSSWYSFHQKLFPEGLERQCRLAKQLGMESVIVDDGWQTDDNSRGYAYCGDWEVTPVKFADFAAHVARVHDIGMKYILWFSVPFVGIHSKAYRRFEGKVLNPATKDAWYVLDPRFPEVREYLISLYESFMTRYRIDGFKLDFVDTFEPSPETRDTLGGGRDIDSVPEAVDRLLTDVMARLRAANPEVLVEFRQSYIGPMMRKYGNMFRSGDVPGDFHGNRLNTLDIRLISGDTPAHSDMVMWHASDSVESAAMQLWHTLFSVPQVSVLLDRLPPSHVDMVRHYISFWRRHADVLLDGELVPMEPGLLYPAVVAADTRKLVAAWYGSAVIPIPSATQKEIVFVNGTLGDSVVCELGKSIGRRKVTVRDCTGKVVSEEARQFRAGLHRMEIPPAGTAEMIG
jgi:alpha-galactosidase